MATASQCKTQACADRLDVIKAEDDGDARTRLNVVKRFPGVSAVLRKGAQKSLRDGRRERPSTLSTVLEPHRNDTRRHAQACPERLADGARRQRRRLVHGLKCLRLPRRDARPHETRAWRSGCRGGRGVLVVHCTTPVIWVCLVPFDTIWRAIICSRSCFLHLDL